MDLLFRGPSAITSPQEHTEQKTELYTRYAVTGAFGRQKSYEYANIHALQITYNENKPFFFLTTHAQDANWYKISRISQYTQHFIHLH
jgi:hypothetical protein